MLYLCMMGLFLYNVSGTVRSDYKHYFIKSSQQGYKVGTIFICSFHMRLSNLPKVT